MKVIAAIIAGVLAIGFLFTQGASLVTDVRTQISEQISGLTSQVTDLLPGGDPYALGLDEGTKFRTDTSYIDQLDIGVIPGASEFVQSFKDGTITESLVGDFANLYWPVAALKSGIVDISAENRAEFRRGVIEAYFDKNV
jgi:hypothetical protein